MPFNMLNFRTSKFKNSRSLLLSTFVTYLLVSGSIVLPYKAVGFIARGATLPRDFFSSSSASTGAGKPAAPIVDRPVTSPDPEDSNETFVSVSDLEWSALSTHTQSICLLIWDKKEFVPSGFLTNPKYSDTYKDTEKIYSKIKNQDGAISSQNPLSVMVDGVLCQRDLISRADYVVEDPSNKGVALYLDAEGYRKLSNSCVSARKELRLLYFPGSNRSKFPPRKAGSISTTWVRRTNRAVFPFVASDPFSWANYIHPSISSRRSLELAKPKDSAADPLSPTEKIGNATGYLVRCFSTLQSVIFLHSIPANIAWGMLAICLTFHHLWYYTSLRHACAVFKEANRLTFKYLAGTPETTSQGVAIGVSKHGLPKLIPTFLRTRMAAGHHTTISCVLFCLQVPRMYCYRGQQKISAIVGEYTGDTRALELIAAYIPLVFQVLQLPTLQERGCGEFGDEEASEMLSPLGQITYFFTNKAGPNGQALLSAIFDSVALTNNPALMTAFASYCQIVNAPYLVTTVTRLSALTRSFQESMSNFFDYDFPRPRVGKISFVIAPFGKLRLVAIPAYFIQMMFRPIHLLVFQILRLIPTDCTFNQDKGVDRISKEGGYSLKSYDLSSATDRLPLAIQIPVLVCIALACKISVEKACRLADAWATVIRLIPFHYPTRSKGASPKIVKYAVGHPMGTYSSWAVFTLSHHLLVQICAYLVLFGYVPGGAFPSITHQNDRSIYERNMDKSRLARPKLYKGVDYKNSFTPSGWYLRYQLLGDDIVLFSNSPYEIAVSEVYFFVLNLIGVEINPSKGFISENGSFEFAKRFVRKGVHLNRLYWGEWSFSFNPFDAASRVRKVQDRGFELPSFGYCISAIIGCLPLVYRAKRDLMSQAMLLASSYGKLRKNKLHSYLLSLVYILTLVVYEVDIRLWVRMVLKNHPLPDWRASLAATVPQSSYDIIRKLLDIAALLSKDLSSKTFNYRMNLPTICVKAIIRYFSNCMRNPHATFLKRSFSETFEFIAKNSEFAVLLLLSPPFKVFSFLKVFSNNVIFPEADGIKKYERSVSLDPDDPLKAVERWTSNDHSVTVKDPRSISADAALRNLKVLAALLYAFECLCSAFSVTTEYCEENLALLDDISIIPEFRKLLISAAGRLLFMYDGITYDRPRIDPLRSLIAGGVHLNLYDIFGVTRSKNITMDKGKRKLEEFKALGTFSPSYRNIPRSENINLLLSFDLDKIAQIVCKTVVGANNMFITRLPSR
jgi:hypothetical protein